MVRRSRDENGRLRRRQGWFRPDHYEFGVLRQLAGSLAMTREIAGRFDVPVTVLIAG
jgi:hypothetical protein